MEKKGVNKYLVFDPIDENKGLIKKCNDVFMELWVKSKN